MVHHSWAVIVGAMLLSLVPLGVFALVTFVVFEDELLHPSTWYAAVGGFCALVVGLGLAAEALAEDDQSRSGGARTRHQSRIRTRS